MLRAVRVLLTAACAVLLAASPAAARPTGALESRLAELWTTVLETPGGAAENPVLEGDPCVELRGRVVAPFGGLREAVTCTVEEGTRIFVAAWISECSTFGVGTVYFGATKADLRRCGGPDGVDGGVDAVEAVLDGVPLTLTEVSTRPLHVHLPEENVFGLAGDARTGLSVGHGWVALVRGLEPGTHTLRIRAEGTYPGVDLPFDNVTTIVVEPRHS